MRNELPGRPEDTEQKQIQYIIFPEHEVPTAEVLANELREDRFDITVAPVDEKNDRLGLRARFVGKLRKYQPYVIQGSKEGISTFNSIFNAAKDELAETSTKLAREARKPSTLAKVAVAVGLTVAVYNVLKKRRQDGIKPPIDPDGRNYQ